MNDKARTEAQRADEGWRASIWIGFKSAEPIVFCLTGDC
jgi:hypothetical protein